MVESAFSEVIVDYTTGKVANAETISESDDLSAARKQAAAVAHAKNTLASTVDKAENDLLGSRAVSVTPELSKGHAVAVIRLQQGVVCGEGYIDVLAQQDELYVSLGRIATSPGARTALYVPSLDRLVVAVRTTPTSPAAVWLFRPQP
jgi:hypothetical protein